MTRHSERQASTTWLAILKKNRMETAARMGGTVALLVSWALAYRVNLDLTGGKLSLLPLFPIAVAVFAFGTAALISRRKGL